MVRISLVVGLVIFCVVSCNFKKGPENIIPEMVGKRVALEDLTSFWMGRDSLYLKTDSSLVKLIVFYDSTACQSCRVKTMFEWESFIEMEKKTNGKFVFMPVFSPSKNEYEQFLRLLAISRFKHHVWVDSSGSFLRNNKFLPEDKFYYAFLVDESNSILIVGDPIVNPNLVQLYDKVINRKLHEE